MLNVAATNLAQSGLRGGHVVLKINSGALCFSKIAKIANPPTSQGAMILGGSERDFFGLRSRCENKWA